MRRSRMSPENRPSKPPPGMRGGNAGAGARGPGCEGRNTGPERGDRSLSPERESLLPKSALQIRHPKRGAECGGRSGSERETGVHRPEHGTGVRAGVRRQECGDRSAETGVRRQEYGDRSARTGCEDRSAGSKRKSRPSRNTGPECRTGVRAGVRGSKCEADAGRNARTGAHRPKHGVGCGKLEREKRSGKNRARNRSMQAGCGLRT